MKRLDYSYKLTLSLPAILQQRKNWSPQKGFGLWENEVRRRTFGRNVGSEKNCIMRRFVIYYQRFQRLITNTSNFMP